MSDSHEQNLNPPDPPSTGAEPDPEQVLEDLGKHIAEARKKAHDDLDMGGRGRTFADEGVSRQVENDGDTSHPLPDRR